MHESSEEPDLGAADPAVMAALAGYRDRTIGCGCLAALARADFSCRSSLCFDKAETTAGGARVEKSSHMATVSTTGRDGRRDCWRSPRSNRSDDGDRMPGRCRRRLRL